VKLELPIFTSLFNNIGRAKTTSFWHFLFKFCTFGDGHAEKERSYWYNESYGSVLQFEWQYGKLTAQSVS
jgi:hypothetical protein